MHEFIAVVRCAARSMQPALGEPALREPALREPALGKPALGEPSVRLCSVGECVRATETCGVARSDSGKGSISELLVAAILRR